MVGAITLTNIALIQVFNYGQTDARSNRTAKRKEKARTQDDRESFYPDIHLLIFTVWFFTNIK